MPDYSKCIIYTIRTPTGLYVGATCNFTRRKYEHKNAAHDEKSKKYNRKLYKNIREHDNEWEMKPYIEFPCENKMEMNIEEERIRRELHADLNVQSCYGHDKEKVAKQAKRYQQKYKEKIAVYQKEYNELNKEKLVEHKKQYRENNKEWFAEYHKQYRKNNKEKLAEYRENNKERVAEYKKEYRKNNKEKLAEYQKQYREKKKAEIIN